MRTSIAGNSRAVMSTKMEACSKHCILTEMDKEDKDLINENYVEILRSLTTAVDDVCIQLWREHIITDIMKENILAKSSPLKRADVLLDLIVTRGPKAFEALYKSVLDAGLFDTADILHPERSPHETTANNAH